MAAAPAQGLVVAKGTAVDSEGNAVQVAVKMDQGQPRTVDLDYAPTHLFPRYYTSFMGEPAIRAGITGVDYFDEKGELETLVCHLHLFDLQPKPGRNDNHWVGKVRRFEQTTFQISGYDIYFVPDGSSQGSVVESHATPTIYPTQTRSSVDKVSASLDLNVFLDWNFDVGRIQAYPRSTVANVAIHLQRAGRKKWRIKMTTLRRYFFVDVWEDSPITATGYLRAR